MGFFSALADWIRPAVRVVRNVVNKVDTWLNGSSVCDEYTELSRRFDRQQTSVSTRSSEPDFLSAIEVQTMQNKIGDVERKLERHSQNQNTTNKTLALQTEVMKLAVSAGNLDRYSHNIRLHASNLAIHLQTIRNTKGLVDDVNSLRSGLYRVMGTVNHIANLMNSEAGSAKVNKIEGIDIDVKDGSISLAAAYQAFEKTRTLLVEEIMAVSKLADEHHADVRRVQQKAAELGAFGDQVIDFLEGKVVPKLNTAKQMSKALKRDLEALPVIPREEKTFY